MSARHYILPVLWSLLLSAAVLPLLSSVDHDAYERGRAEGEAAVRRDLDASINDANVTCQHAEARCVELCERTPQDCIPICDRLDREAEGFQ